MNIPNIKKRSRLLAVLASFLLIALDGKSQITASYFDIEKQIRECHTCLIDTLKLDEELTEITFKDTVNEDQNGRIVLNNNYLTELVWNTSDISYSFMFNEKNQVYFSNVSIKGVGKFLTFFNDLGGISQIEQYNDEALENGWQIQFAENGSTIKKTYFINGKQQ